MISSMTGFGRGSVIVDGKRITIEIKSLNSKQLDLNCRVPSTFKELEISLRRQISSGLERGKVEMTATVEHLVAEPTTSINTELLKRYKSQLEELGAELGLGEPSDWYHLLLRMPDSMKTETVAMTEDENNGFFEACRLAVEEVRKFRKEEGMKLYKFFIEKIHAIEELLNSVEPYEKDRILRIRERLEEQLRKLNSIEYDRSRLEQELIFYIEKLDITEEKTRLASHLKYFLETLGGPDELPAEGQGKKLGFISQEMGREINTLGSKSNQADMQKIVVKMKDELEQIKEQVLNVL